MNGEYFLLYATHYFMQTTQTHTSQQIMKLGMGVIMYKKSKQYVQETQTASKWKRTLQSLLTK